MLHATPIQATTPFADENERPMLRDVVTGVLLGMVLFAIISTLIVRFAFSDQSWGAALVVGGFAGFWAGLFFGSAAGIVYYQRHVSNDDESALTADDSISAQVPTSGSAGATAQAPRTPVHQ